MAEVDGRPSAEPLDADEAAERRAAIGPVTSRRAGLLVGGLAVVVVVVVGIWMLAENEPSEPRETALPSRYVVELDAETGEERQVIAYPNPGRPEVARLGTAIAVGQGAIWIGDSTAYAPTVQRVDPRHGEMRPVVVRTSLGTFNLSIDTAFDAVWVASDRLIRINPATDEVRPVLQIPLPIGGSGGSSSLAVAAADLGIGSGHASIGDQSLVRELLAIPAELEPAMLIALGSPADRPLTPVDQPARRPFDDVVHADRW